jgi:hypothetical protein
VKRAFQAGVLLMWLDDAGIAFDRAGKVKPVYEACYSCRAAGPSVEAIIKRV